MMLDFVNHSSIIIRENDVSLMCDFWQDGAAFDNGWQLLCEPTFEYSDFENISHLWFSHEHPDHFSPANLKSLPERYRKKITVLFQATEDKRVVSFCRKIGFKEVIELTPYETRTIGDGVQIMCAPYGAPWGDVDSWLFVKTPTATLLNINDCEIESEAGARKIANACGPIDILATQFSFASKQANARDKDWTADVQKHHLDRLAFKLQSFAPRYSLPFASFVYWSHDENRYLNQGAIKVQQAAELMLDLGIQPLVMYPGDSWRVGSEWNNEQPLLKYSKRYDWLGELPDSKYAVAEVVSREQLTATADEFVANMLKGGSYQRLSRYIAIKHARISNRTVRSAWRRNLNSLLAGVRGKAEPVRIFVEDHDQTYSFSIESGLQTADHPVNACHIRINSAALQFGFSAGFGGETLQVNGRFNNEMVGGWRYMSAIFFLARRIEQGMKIPRFVVANAVATTLGLRRSRPSW